MAKKNEVVEATVVENSSNPVVQKTPVQILAEQQTNLKAQLEQARGNMKNLQQQFESQKTLALKLEGAIEAGDLLLKSLSK